MYIPLVKKSYTVKMSGPFNKANHTELGSHALKKKGKNEEYIRENVLIPFIFLFMELCKKYFLPSWDKIVYFRSEKKKKT